jgi:hypothetical protein
MLESALRTADSLIHQYTGISFHDGPFIMKGGDMLRNRLSLGEKLV